MDKKEFEDKWKHLFKIVRDKTIYPADEPTSENILVLMLRDAIEVIEKEPDAGTRGGDKDGTE